MRKGYLRRTTIIAFAMIMACTPALSGCGKKQIDMSVLEDEAQTPEEDEAADMSSLAYSLKLPEGCDVEFDTGSSKMEFIKAKDDIIDLPDTEKIQVCTFDTYQFTSEEIQSLVEKMFDKTKGIKARPQGLRTKPELQYEIDFYQKNIEDNPDDDIEWYQQQIDLLKKKLVDAPEEIPDLESYEDPYQEYQGIYNDTLYEFDVYKSFDTSSKKKEDLSSGVGFFFKRLDDEERVKEVDDAQYFFVGDPEDWDDMDVDGIEDNTSLTEDAALSKAMAFLEEIGITGLVNENATKAANIWTKDDGMRVEVVKTEYIGYVFNFRRAINGAIIENPGTLNADNLQDNEGYIMGMGCDMLEVVVTGDGIYRASGQLYVDPDSIKYEDVTLLSFPEMLEKAQVNMAKYYEKHPTQYKKIQYNDVSLVYTPVMREDGTRAFIPAWSFRQYDEFTSNENWIDVKQLAYIDAADGSYIDIMENAKKLGFYDYYH